MHGLVEARGDESVESVLGGRLRRRVKDGRLARAKKGSETRFGRLGQATAKIPKKIPEIPKFLKPHHFNKLMCTVTPAEYMCCVHVLSTCDVYMCTCVL